MLPPSVAQGAYPEDGSAPPPGDPGTEAGLFPDGTPPPPFDNFEQGEPVDPATATILGHAAIIRSVETLARNPEMGVKVRAGLQEANIFGVRAVMRVLRRQFGHLIDARSGQPPLEHEVPLGALLRRLTQDGHITTVVNTLAVAGALEGPPDVPHIAHLWTTLAGHLGTYVTPAFRARPEIHREEKRWSFQEVFSRQPPAVLAQGLLRLESGHPAECAAVAAFLQPGARGVLTIDAQKGLRRLEDIITTAYKEFVRSAPAGSTYAAKSQREVLRQERRALARLTGSSDNGVSIPATYDAAVQRGGGEKETPAERLVQRGMYRILDWYSQRNYIPDLSKFMKALGIPEQELKKPPVILLEPYTLSTAQEKMVLDFMAPAPRKPPPRPKIVRGDTIAMSLESLGFPPDAPMTDELAATLLLPYLEGKKRLGSTPPDQLRAAYEHFRPCFEELGADRIIPLNLGFDNPGYKPMSLRAISQKGGHGTLSQVSILRKLARQQISERVARKQTAAE